MISADDPHAETKVRIGNLLDEALALADFAKGHGVAAHIADALHALDPQRRIALPPDEDTSH